MNTYSIHVIPYRKGNPAFSMSYTSKTLKALIARIQDDVINKNVWDEYLDAAIVIRNDENAIVAMKSHDKTQFRTHLLR